MRNILIILLLWPTITFAQDDIKSFLHMPKQLDSNIHVTYYHDSGDADILSSGVKTIEREVSIDVVDFNYHYGLFDDLTLIFGFDKSTATTKDKYITSAINLELESKDTGLSDFRLGAQARIKDGTTSSIFMDILFEFSPGILTSKTADPKSNSTSGFSAGKPGNNANGGHVFEGGVQFGKPMTGAWEWQVRLLYTLNLKAEETDLADNTRDSTTSFSEYLLNFKVQKFLPDKQSSLWSELTYAQISSFELIDSTGSATTRASSAAYQLLIGSRTSLLWPSFYAGIFGGISKFEDIDGTDNGTTTLIKGLFTKIVGIEFLFTI